MAGLQDACRGHAVIPKESTAAQSAVCPGCGGEWAAAITLVGVVLVICDRCKMREPVVAHAPASAPKGHTTRRSVATLSDRDVRAVVRKIERGEWKSMSDAAHALHVDAEHLRRRLIESLSEQRYNTLIARIHGRSYGGGHHLLFRRPV